MQGLCALKRKYLAIYISIFLGGLLAIFMSNFAVVIVHNMTGETIRIQRVGFGLINSHVVNTRLESRDLASYFSIFFSPNFDAQIEMKFSSGKVAVSSCKVDVRSVDVCPLYIVGEGVLDCSECKNR